MAGNRLLQPSFASGEMAPALWGRVDIDRYGIAAKLLSGWIVRPDGGLQSRPGTRFIREAEFADRVCRLIPFDVSESISYVVELGHLYARFHYQGTTIMDGGSPEEIVTPWTEAQIFDVAFTQSADTLFMAHPSYPIQLLRRVSATEFSITPMTPREGPFASLNSNESRVMSASAKTGTVTITTNFDIFTSNMVGTLIYMEQKALGQIRPWVQGERTKLGGGELIVGSLRRSDGKVYRAVTVPTPPSGTGNWTETGNVRPIHELGREWDGPGDVRDSGSFKFSSGVEWEYVHSGYGIVQVTGYTNARSVTATVKKTLPDGVVGGVGTPANTWTRSGNGTTVTFSITGASSPSNSNYTVTVNGENMQSDPNYTPPGGGWGGGPGDELP